MSPAYFASGEKAEPEVIYFYSSHCEECAYLKQEFFPPIKKKFGGTILWREINIDESPQNLELAFKLVFKDKKVGTLAPSIVAGDTVLMGAGKIEEGLDGAIKEMLEAPAIRKPEISGKDPYAVFKDISLPVILVSGLADGVNPCAFAAIALLISIMYVYAYKRKEIAAICLSYCLAVFIAYFVIGLGFLNILYSLKYFYRIASVFRNAVAALCFFFALVSIYDFIVYRKTGESRRLLLVLPDFLKKKISLTIGGNLREPGNKGIIALSAGAFACGLAVSCLEMACTGQVYLPVLVYIFKESKHRPEALTYIFIYNLMFIFPLLIATALFLFGVKSQAFNSFLKKYTGWLKLGLALVFAVLGTVILFF
jgi:cytochrome c biogenesis protein CcdA